MERFCQTSTRRAWSVESEEQYLLPCPHEPKLFAEGAREMRAGCLLCTRVRGNSLLLFQGQQIFSVSKNKRTTAKPLLILRLYTRMQCSCDKTTGWGRQTRAGKFIRLARHAHAQCEDCHDIHYKKFNAAIILQESRCNWLRNSVQTIYKSEREIEIRAQNMGSK